MARPLIQADGSGRPAAEFRCVLFTTIMALAVGAPASHALAESGPLPPPIYVVDAATGDDGNTGSASDPFATVGRGLQEAQPGDWVIVRPGTYFGIVETVRDGGTGLGSEIRVQAEKRGTATLIADGTVLRVAHADHLFYGFVIDGMFGPAPAVDVESGARSTHLSDLEIRNSGRDCVAIGWTEWVRIEDTEIHHCLFWDDTTVPPGPAPAHGISGAVPTRLRLSDVEIHHVSGDALHISTTAAFFDDIHVERSVFWTGPLSAAAGSFPAGTMVGDSAFEVRTPPAPGPRARVAFYEVVAYGFVGSLADRVAFDIRDNVELVVDRATVFNNDVAFRLAGPDALVTLRNVVAYENGITVRYEAALSDLRVVNVTFIDSNPFHHGGGKAPGPWTIANALFLDVVPTEAIGPSNMAVGEWAFAVPAANDYHLETTIGPVDSGEQLDDVTRDRDGVPRPLGAAHDIGAYEKIPLPIVGDSGADADIDANLDDAGGTSNGGGGCRCACIVESEAAPTGALGMLLLAVVLLTVRRWRCCRSTTRNPRTRKHR